MSYTLNSNDRRILQQTINTVNNLPVNPKGGKRPTIKNAFAYAELTAQDENGLWSAFEVYFDETGTPNELTDGRVWGLEIPSIIVNGTVSAGTVIRVERYYYVDSSNDEQPIWIGSAVGGGTAYIRVRFPNQVSLPYNETTSGIAEVINDNDDVIQTLTTLKQGVFSQAIILQNEIMLAEIIGDICDVTISMTGVGVGNWSE